MIEWFIEHAWIGNKKNLTDKEKLIVRDAWKDWVENEMDSNLIGEERVLIADPPRNVGLFYLPKLLEPSEENWKTYIIRNVKINKGEYGNIYFDSLCFSLVYVLNTLSNYFKGRASIDIMTINQGVNALAFRINEDYAIGISEKIHCDEADDNKITLSKTAIEYDSEGKVNIKVIGKKTHLWNGWKVVQSENWRGREIKKYAYHKNYLFEELEDEGDSLLI